jgi:voltage-gated potassium channel
VTVIGQWVCGTFTCAKGPDTRIEPGAILVVAGAHANLAKVERLAIPIRRSGPIVLAGYGTVGSKVVEMLSDADETTIVIDQEALPGVDIVGNVLEHATMERASVRSASAVVLALSNDSEGVFATAVVRDHAPEVPLIVRANRAPNIPRLYQAGADFALSVGQVAGQILAYHLRGEQAVAVQHRLKFIRVAAGGLAWGHPWRDQVRERTGAAVVAVERGETCSSSSMMISWCSPDDILFVCGTPGSLESYLQRIRDLAGRRLEPPEPPATAPRRSAALSSLVAWAGASCARRRAAAIVFRGATGVRRTAPRGSPTGPST